MKNVSLAGRLTKDSELKSTQSGELLRFSVAVDGWARGEKKTEFFGVSLFGKRAGNLAQFLKKGTAVGLSGDLSTFTAENGRTYLEVTTNDVTLQGGKSADASDRSGGDYGAASGKPANFSNAMDDDIPFNMEWR